MALTKLKFASISFVSSSKLWLILVIHSSVSAVYSDCSIVMYMSVFLLFLCPNMYCTCLMSLVLWYSIVAFQCLNVWKLIFVSLGFCSFSLTVLRCSQKYVLRYFDCGWKTVSRFFGSLLIIAISLSLIGSMRGLLPFSGVTFKVLFW